jgi:MftR C-terminal domain
MAPVAFRRFLLQPAGLLGQLESGDARALEMLRTVHRMIAASPALQAREQRALSEYATALAELLATETGAGPDVIRARAAAHAVMGVQRVLIDYVRERILSNDRPDRLAADVRRLGKRAFALLEDGLGGYAPKPAADRSASAG